MLKIGSSIIASPRQGLNEKRMQEIVNEVAGLRQRGLEVLIVSSGAVLCGMEKLGLTARPKAIAVKQAVAAVGQVRLMWFYEKLFSLFGIQVAQILLTQEDLDDRKRFLNSRNTLQALLERRVVPIINENDTVTVEEIRFGDNDNLAASVTHLIDAQLLVILSDVDGLFTRDPREHSDARLIQEVSDITPAVEALAGGAAETGTGGMASKVQTAKKVAAYGVPTLILNGSLTGGLTQALSCTQIGTLFHPHPSRLSSRKQWIAHTLKIKGYLTLDPGAVEAVAGKGKSLLPSGVVSVEGRFEAGDAVACLGPDGIEIGRGLINYDSTEVARIAGVRSADIENRLGYKLTDELVHRDNLVVLRPTGKKDGS